VILAAEEERKALAIASFRRLALAGGFDPIPVEGKIPVQKGWQKIKATDTDIASWSTNFPKATNTGLQTERTPTLDIDIHDEEAAAAVEALIRAQFGDRGLIPVRFGRRPKRALPFRTDTPFAKITANLATANDPAGLKGQKLEFLASGQQFVADGIHPETLKSYEWEGGAPGELARMDLAPITESEARALVADAVELLTVLHGYYLPVRKAKAGANGTAGAGKLNGAGHGLFGRAGRLELRLFQSRRSLRDGDEASQSRHGRRCSGQFPAGPDRGAGGRGPGKKGAAAARSSQHGDVGEGEDRRPSRIATPDPAQDEAEAGTRAMAGSRAS
jgi:Bifunctional DNA primase/polymerase, N-terminal